MSEEKHTEVHTSSEHEHHHGHDHEHEHEHSLVEITRHEGAVIGSLSGRMKAESHAEAEEKLAAQMKKAAEKITSSGGIIGHIKFICSTLGETSQISVTDISENIRRFDTDACDIEGVAIVFNVEDKDLEEILEETVGSLLETAHHHHHHDEDD